ncbi:MAG: hypothetical protein L6R38_007872 [Xanthoria sp. 2 TBL-2021]|nr:MAG: hypothetical protein L6R38_007872 [Xanthoria sp. 2 TBL-2021]
MKQLNILICGGGCAGPSLAFWLARAGHHVTIVERFPALRATGAQIDIRDQGISVLKRMGLLDTVRSMRVLEAGFSFVDAQGKSKATIMANTSGKGAQTMTSEYEIMRGDLVRILYDATQDSVEYIFGKTVEHFEQDEHSVTVHFSDGMTGMYDMLVGADGQGSRIRAAIQPSDAPDPVRHLGAYLAYWFIPRTATDDHLCRLYHIPGSRMIMSRTHSPTEGQANFAFRDDSEELRSMPRASLETQKQFWSEKFHDAGWQTDRFIQGMQTTQNFYCQEVVQIHTDTWSKGRVVLLADAAHCPSPMTAMGTTSALVGAYVLAAEINRNSHDLPQAFANYDRTLRPFINEIQTFKPWMLRLILPETSFAITLIHLFAGLLVFLRLPDLLARFIPENRGGWQLPEYPPMEQTA